VDATQKPCTILVCLKREKKGNKKGKKQKCNAMRKKKRNLLKTRKRIRSSEKGPIPRWRQRTVCGRGPGGSCKNYVGSCVRRVIRQRGKSWYHSAIRWTPERKVEKKIDVDIESKRRGKQHCMDLKKLEVKGEGGSDGRRF